MTKDGALLAMMAGEKISHQYFMDEEYLYMDKGTIMTEDGYALGNERGPWWANKAGDNWKAGWKLYKEN